MNSTIQHARTLGIFKSSAAIAKMVPCLLAVSLLSQPVLAQMTAPPPTAQPSQPVMAPSSTSALKIQTGSQKVPAGTMLTIGFNTDMDSRTTNTGDAFNAYLTQDFTVKGENATRRVVLPAGTTVRGRVQEVKRPTFFSRGGAIYLSFDHVVVPSGELLPLTLNLSTENTLVNDQGALYADPGIGKKVQKGVDAGKQTFGNITDQGFSAGKQIAGGLGSLITVPAAVVGGALAGTAVTTGKAAVAVVGKGDSVIIKPGDTVTIDFGGSFNLPAE
ncbi:hypothetical protein [Vampirovibrio sp.]|uniref:hypothetical protein n=1 Tax=Vampirovibrio sp. TaxID=2717857 RepID=UPI00359334B6